MVKKLIFFCVLILSFSCKDNTRINNCFQNSISPITLDLNSPQLNGVLTPTGFVKIPGGISGIILYNGATLGFKAFDRRCPDNDCNKGMSFDGLRLKCPCNGSEYSILTGEPLTKGNNGCFAREYTVTKHGSSLVISN